MQETSSHKKIIVGIIVAIVVIGVAGILWMKSSNDTTVPSGNALESHEAITIVQVTNPELLSYPSEDLPPKTIEAEAGENGWYIGFFTLGSGRPGVLNGLCYFVSADKEVTQIGEFKAGAGDAPSTLDLTTCKP